MNTVHDVLNLIIPRDQNGEFESLVVPKVERRDTRTEDTIFQLFQTGLKNDEIFESLYEKKYSRGTISNITETVIASRNTERDDFLEAKESGSIEGYLVGEFEFAMSSQNWPSIVNYYNIEFSENGTYFESWSITSRFDGQTMTSDYIGSWLHIPIKKSHRTDGP